MNAIIPAIVLAALVAAVTVAMVVGAGGVVLRSQPIRRLLRRAWRSHGRARRRRHSSPAHR
jgi:energy-converting hydrogenase Eha subunit C